MTYVVLLRNEQGGLLTPMLHNVELPAAKAFSLEHPGCYVQLHPVKAGQFINVSWMRDGSACEPPAWADAVLSREV